MIQGRAVMLTVIMAGACAASCSSGSGVREAKPAVLSVQPTSPNISVKVGPAPSQDPDGGKLVLFDPCRSIGDDVIVRTGFDPATRKRSDQVHTGYAFISCGFSREEFKFGNNQITGFLHISSTNITMDQFRQREGGDAATVTVNGNEAVSYPDQDGKSCHVITRGPDNSLNISVEDVFAPTVTSVCNRARDVATIVDTAVTGAK